MKEIPIIFSTEMVQAILENRKFMTRRVIKPQPVPPPDTGSMFDWDWGWEQKRRSYGVYERDTRFREKMLAFCPYGQKGDKLFVKETWKVMFIDDMKFTILINYKADDEHRTVQFSPERFEKFKKFFGKNGWQSPYFMPKEAARLWLDNEGVKVERLQEITEEDAKAEGSQLLSHDGKTIYTPNYRAAFRVLWDSINAKRGHGWEQNNWLWVAFFKRTN